MIIKVLFCCLLAVVLGAPPLKIAIIGILSLESGNADGSFHYSYEGENGNKVEAVGQLKLLGPDQDGVVSQALYGKKTVQQAADSPRPTHTTPGKEEEDLCEDATIDTIFSNAEGETFVFKGERYWKLNDDGFADGYPRPISQSWVGLPANMDAAYTDLDGKTYFFKGSQFWRYTGMRMDGDYPKLISEGFTGIPDNVDVALIWSGDGKIYFFKGSKFWLFDPSQNPPVKSTFPKPISNWEGLPNDLEAALQYTDGNTYFFKDGQYYRFNDKTLSVATADPPFPRGAGYWWFGCSSKQAGIKTFGGNQKLAPGETGDEHSERKNESKEALYWKTTVQQAADSPRPTHKTPGKEENDLCEDATIDTIFNNAEGDTFVFKGERYWKLNDDGFADGYPRPISQSWVGLPANMDAAYTDLDGKTYFFKGSHFWRYTGMRMDGDYPKLISEGFTGIPDNVDVALIWSGDGKIYFFKGSKFWLFDPSQNPPVKSTFPKPISNWEGLPNDLEAALQYTDGNTYFFKDGQYYKLNDRTFSVATADPPFPRGAGYWWFGCSSKQAGIKTFGGNQQLASGETAYEHSERKNESKEGHLPVVVDIIFDGGNHYSHRDTRIFLAKTS